MRIWSLHPQYLDRQGLTACWRESLLAQAVLSGRTRGYAAHPQLERFRADPDPLTAIGEYLGVIADEATTRGYRFDRTRIMHESPLDPGRIAVTTGQLALEWEHLRGKLVARSPELRAHWDHVDDPEAHPLFRVEKGPAAPWERARP